MIGSAGCDFLCLQLQVTAKPTSMRDDSELTPILRVLQKVEFTAALETAVLRQLARFVMYESYPAADHVVVKQGDPGALFYIILSGSPLLSAASPMGHLSSISLGIIKCHKFAVLLCTNTAATPL